MTQECVTAAPRRRDRRRAAVLLAGLSLSLGMAAPPVAAEGADAAVGSYQIAGTRGQAWVGASRNIYPTGGDDAVIELTTTHSSAARRLPFPITIYGRTLTRMAVSTNGNVQFPGVNYVGDAKYTNTCLPTLMPSPFVPVYWDDLHFQAAGSGEGIFTRTIGQAPNRQFIINWDGRQLSDGLPVRAGVVFRERSNDFFMQYGDNSAPSATIGVQEFRSTSNTQWSCNEGPAVVSGLRLNYTHVR